MCVHIKREKEREGGEGILFLLGTFFSSSENLQNTLLEQL